MAGETEYAERSQVTRVFISYSRRDKDFADALLDQLGARGFEAYLDQHDILPGEPWRERLAGLIAAADTVVFCLSPNFVASKICDWEVNEAERLGKRLLPAVAADTPDDDIPQRLKRLNYIFMRGEAEFAGRMDALVAALETDIDWIRSHTRLGQLAAEWDRGKRSTELVLRGAALVAAEQWISAQPAKGPSPTDLQRDFIRASRAEALAHAVRVGRTQVLIGLLAAAVLAGIGYLGWANRAALEFQSRLLLDDLTPAFVSVLSPSAERAMHTGESFKECASCPEMVVIPAGQFLMGSAARDGPDSELPQHEVAIATRFAVSRFLITFDQWDACLAHKGCNHRADDRGWGRGLIPVTDVSWSDARSYVEWLSKQTGRPYRLLSEAEWEYAARAGSKTQYPWGDELGQDNANCPGSESQWADKQPSPVGTFAPNVFGLYDMIGNLWEWVEDNWHPDYVGAPRDGSVWQGGDAAQRVLRGGSYAVTAGECNSSFRDFARPPDFRNYIFGVRVARSLAAAE
jgi:formylglycine-generating enzyme required for sulfatase activity